VPAARGRQPDEEDHGRKHGYIILCCARSDTAKSHNLVRVEVPPLSGEVPYLVFELGTPLRYDLVHVPEWDNDAYYSGGPLCCEHILQKKGTPLQGKDASSLLKTVEDTEMDLNDRVSSALTFIMREDVRKTFGPKARKCLDVVLRGLCRTEQALLTTVRGPWTHCGALRVRQGSNTRGVLSDVSIKSDVTSEVATELNERFWRNKVVLTAKHISVMQLAMMGVIDLTMRDPQRGPRDHHTWNALASVQTVTLDKLVECAAVLDAVRYPASFLTANADAQQHLVSTDIVDKDAHTTVIVVKSASSDEMR
jgi:hypothetical protein